MYGRYYRITNSLGYARYVGKDENIVWDHVEEQGLDNTDLDSYLFRIAIMPNGTV